MFDEIIIYVPTGQAAALTAIAVLVCRAHGYDDVLPEAEEHHVQYTMLRPAGDVHGDAADGFAGTVQHSGLVITAHWTHSAARLVLPSTPNAGPNRFPWHPWCHYFTPRGCTVSTAVLQEAAARQRLKQQQQQLLHSHHQQSHRSTPRLQQQDRGQLEQQLPVELAAIGLHADLAFLHDLASAILQHNESVLQQQQQEQEQQQQGAVDSVADTLADLARRQQQLQSMLSTKGFHSQQQQKQRCVPAVAVTPLLQQTVVGTAAAVIIQSTWRAHRDRLRNRVAERALLNRAVRVIQRAWRSFVLRQRLRMLAGVAAAWQSAQHLKYSSLLCVDVGSRRLAERATERGRDGPGLFPEHRLRYIIDDDGSLFLVDMDSRSPNSSGSSRNSSSGMAGDNDSSNGQSSTRTGNSSNGENLSSTGQSITSTGNSNEGANTVSSSRCTSSNVSQSASGQQMPADASAAGNAVDSSDQEQLLACTNGTAAAAAAVQRPYGFPDWLGIDVPVISAAAAATILEDQLWFEPFGRADATKLLEIGCDVKDILAPELVSDAKLCHPTDVAQLVTFKNKKQAAERAALLAALTYDVRTQSACKLLSVQDTPLGAAYRSATGGSVTSSTAGNAAPAAAAAAGPAAVAASVPQIKLTGPTVTTPAGISAKLTNRSHRTVEAKDAAAAAAAAKSNVSGAAAASLAAAPGSDTARSAAGRDAAEAAAAAAAAVEMLNRCTADFDGQQQHQPIQQLVSSAMVPIKPTETLTAAAAAGSSTDANAAAADSNLQFYIHVYSRLPYLQRLAAAAETAAAASLANELQTDVPKDTRNSTTGSGSDAGSAAAAAADGSSDTGTGVFKPTKKAVDYAAYYKRLKQEQAEALRAKLTTEAAAAAATAAADLQAKQQAIAAAHAAMAAVVAAAAGFDAAADDSSSTSQPRMKHTQQLKTVQCTTPGYRPSSVSAAAAATQTLKQQQQAAAAAVVAAVREEIAAGREAVLRQMATERAEKQKHAQLQTQVLQQQVLQQEQQQQAAAESRVSLLRAIRGAGALARQQQQQIAGQFQQRCNMFGKHLKRGEVAVVRAAQQKAAEIHTTQQRLNNLQATEEAQQRQQETADETKQRALQEKQELKHMLAAAKSITEAEQAAKRAQVAAAVLQEQQALKTYGPSGGVWGSATADESLKQPLRAAIVDTLEMFWPRQESVSPVV